MFKYFASIFLLVTFTVSCIPQNRPGYLPTASSAIQTPNTSTNLQPLTVTAQTTPTRITLQTPSTPGEEPLLVFFVSEQGRFEAWVPVSGDIVEYMVTQTLFGNSLECSAFGFSLNSAIVSIQYCDLASENRDSLSDRAILDEVRNMVKTDNHLKIITEEMKENEGTFPELTLSGEEDVGGNAGTFKGRIILAGNRVYFIHMYVFYIDWCFCRHQMDQVIESLYVDPDISIPFEPTP